MVNFREKKYTNMNYSNSTKMYEIIFAQMYIFLVEKYFFCNFCFKLFRGKKQKMQIIPEMHTFGPKYFVVG